ncbi:MAG: hypothetical protein JWQ98_3554 [Chlorobi bacterium]|nr:hypothetical protein [Chlorobiota bacterium]
MSDSESPEGDELSGAEPVMDDELSDAESATNDELSDLSTLQILTVPGTPPILTDDGPNISVAQGLSVLKEVWFASNRMAELQRQYAGKKIPIEKIFGALLGFGDKPDPLAAVKEQLAEINAKLDRVLAGIQEVQMGLLGLGVLTVYLDIADSVFLIEKYSESLADYLGGDPSLTDADRKDFIDKLLGVRSERDGVSFCAQKIIKLGPNRTPLLFDLLFPYISNGATAENATARYIKGAFVFRFVTDVLLKGLILELFTVTATGDQTKMNVRTEKVVKKYQGWLRAMVENSFLPFAEKLATLRFADEFMGCNDTRTDANLPLKKWSPAKSSILRSADELAARLMGRSKGVILRVIPNIPPIADKVSASNDPRVISAGKYHWEVTKRPATTLNRDTAAEKMMQSAPPFFKLKIIGSGEFTALNVSRAEIQCMEGVQPPPGIDKSRFVFLRYEFDMSSCPERTQFTVYLGNPNVVMASFPFLTTMWRRVYVEDGHPFPEAEKGIQQAVLDMQAGVFDLPSEGQLSPVLMTYAYDMFGQRPAPR